MAALAWILANYEALLVGIIGILTGIIGIAMLVPGDQPEKSLKSVVAFLEKFSKK